ncbi:MAG: hypothetical protein OXN21_09110 [Chloroflexota bacterium]|nr:hypothetical protein [Chloroflexota bacterium]
MLQSSTTVIAAIVLLLTTACTYTVTATPSPTNTPVPIKRISSKPTSTLPAPSLSNSEIVGQVKQYPGVLDAAVSERGNEVSLVLVVSAFTNEAQARQLGDNFVRLHKTFRDSGVSGRSIGTGNLDYLVGVYYPNDKKVAQGAKSRAATRISW